jgi:hypothetical protein
MGGEGGIDLRLGKPIAGPCILKTRRTRDRPWHFFHLRVCGTIRVQLYTMAIPHHTMRMFLEHL